MPINLLQVGDLMLAGSHDAGAYRDYGGEGDDNWATSAVYAQEHTTFYDLIYFGTSKFLRKSAILFATAESFYNYCICVIMLNIYMYIYIYLMILAMQIDMHHKHTCRSG